MDIRFTALGDGTAEEYAYLERRDHELNGNYTADLLAMFRETDREPFAAQADGRTAPPGWSRAR